MTGEISLVGQVLPVGGLKEKILAAHRAGIKTILAPAANRADIEENVPESVKEGIRLVYVDNVSEVLEEVFADTPVLERWKKAASGELAREEAARREKEEREEKEEKREKKERKEREKREKKDKEDRD